MTRKKQVRTVIFDTVKKQKGLSLGIVSAVIGAVVFALIPPLILADIVDSITAGTRRRIRTYPTVFRPCWRSPGSQNPRVKVCSWYSARKSPTRYAAA